MAQMRALVDPLLTNVATQYKPEGFVAEQILPPIKSKLNSGKLGRYGTTHLQIVSSTAGGRGGFKRVDTRSYSTTQFFIESHGLEDVVTKDDYDNVILPFNAEKDTTYALTSMLQIEKEVALATTLRDTTVLTNNVTLAGTAQLSDYTNSDPLGVTNVAKETVRGASGFAPNVAIMDWAVANRLRYHPKILTSLGFNFAKPGSLTDQDLSRALNVERIMIANAQYSTAAEGQTSNMVTIWGKDIIFAYVPASALPGQVSLGYYITKDGESPRQTFKYPINNPPESNGVLVRDNYAMIISAATAGYLVKNAIA